MNGKRGIYDILIFFMALVVSSAVIIPPSYYSSHGFLSPDSTNYLRLAKRILSGHGFYVPASSRGEVADVLFAVWPVGYPTLNAAFSWLFDITTFLASKLLNAFLLSSAAFVLYKEYGRNGLVASGTLFTAGILHNYTFTWSEAPFLTALIFL